MTFSGILRGAAAALCIGLAVAGCGGGDTVEPFQPVGVVAFGDELSFIGEGGVKYSVNPLNDDGSLDCDVNPLWIQIVSRQFGMKFETDPCLEADETPKEKKLSAIDAAAQVLAVSKEPLNAKEMIEAMAAKSLWTSPGGKTPHATLYSAIIREIALKGKEARFVKTERGKFAAKA